MCISYNNMNNNWMYLFQQGLGILGINNTFGSFGSFGNFGSMSMNGSLFNYNVNYDAMAGIAVANAVLGVTGQAISSSRAEKQAEKQEYANNQARLEQIEKEISDLKKTDITKEVDTRSKTDSEVKSKQTAFDTASSNLQNAVDYIKNNETAYKAAKGKADGGKDLTSDEQQLIKVYEEKLAKQTELKTAKEKAETELNTAKNALKTTIEKEIKDKINDLKAEKEKLQKEVDSYDLDAANGNSLSRTSDKKYEALLNNGVAPKGSYTKANVKTAVDRFMKALDGTPEKLQTAKNLVTMFNGCSDWNETLQKAANVAQRYVNEHKDEK